MSNLFTSSIGKKLMMSLAGLFLIVFLIVHLSINLTLILFDSTEPFNKAAHFMGTNILIKIFEFILFGFLFLHIIYASILQIQNLLARPKGYEKTNNSQLSFFSKYVLHTSVIIAIFLTLHLIDFWIKNKFFDGIVQTVLYSEKTYRDLAQLVIDRFQIGWVVIAYVVLLFGLGFHLHHGFQSAFQTLGINHEKYTPKIKLFGVIFTVTITLGYMAIPVVIYFVK